MIETAAAPVFEAMLDEDPDYALPRRWPLQPDERITMAWWIAAQILRTTRQARRIEHLAAAADGNQLSFSQSLRSHVGRNEHLRFIGSQIEAMAWVIFSRPWGLGYSLACLLTGDVPALIMNAQDHEDQIAAVAVWGITLPLDPHRCLIVPGLPDVREDPQKAVDHLAALESPFGLFTTRPSSMRQIRV